MIARWVAEIEWPDALRYAAASFLAVSALLLVAELVHLMRTTPVLPAPAADHALSSGVPEVTRDSFDIEALLSHDPFRVRRTSYLPEDGLPLVAPAEAIAKPRLLGTVVTPGIDSFAVVALGGGAPVVLRPGGRLGDLRLTVLGRGRVLLTPSAGAPVELRVTGEGGRQP